MILHDVTIPGKDGLWHIQVDKGKIIAVTAHRSSLQARPGENRVESDGAIALPGFINSHDHLDFNLFPPAGNRVYHNYTEWAADIHVANQKEIQKVRTVPLPLRIQWGLYKNLLNGFTTVVNHGRRLQVSDDLVSVFQDCCCLHSAAFEKKWKWKLRQPLNRNKPVVMHIGEGTDAFAAAEAGKVIRANWWRKKIVAIHAVAMKEQEAAAFAGLVWCPASNYFLLGKSADIRRLQSYTTIVFGTDSTLTSSWNCWKHFREAAGQTGIDENQLLDMLTVFPAKLWGMQDRGQIEAGKSADLLLLPKNKRVADGDPSAILLIMHKGIMKLVDAAWSDRVAALPDDEFDRITMDGKVKFVKGRINQLVSAIRSFFPEAFIPFETTT